MMRGQKPTRAAWYAKNTRLVLRKSFVDGQGLFVTKPMKKGARLWMPKHHGGFNRSCVANAKMIKVAADYVIATRDIQAFEEVYLGYRLRLGVSCNCIVCYQHRRVMLRETRKLRRRLLRNARSGALIFFPTFGPSVGLRHKE